MDNVIGLSEMPNHERVRDTSYLLRGNAKIWWWMLYDTYLTYEMTWPDFRKTFDKEYLFVDMFYVQALEFINIKQK